VPGRPGGSAEAAALAIAQQLGRPHTPTDQACIETLLGHVKGQWPRLEAIGDPSELEAGLDRIHDEHNTIRLHAGIGYLIPDNEHTGRGEAIRQARRDRLAATRTARTPYRRTQQETTPGEQDH